MNDLFGFVVRHGPAVLFGWVLVDQAGVPLPAVPLLLVIGALAGAGRLSLFWAIGATVGAEELPFAIPGALRISPDDLERRHDEIPRDAEIVLYCT